MPTLVIKNPDGSEQEQDVSEQLTIGRAEGNDLILSEGGVSRKHARFFTEGADFMVEDTGSANGTWVDGEKIAGPTKLSSKSQVVIGDYEIQLKLGSKALPKRATGKPSKEPTTARGTPVKATAPRSTRVVPAVKSAPGAGLAKRAAPGRAAGPQLRGLTGGVTGKTFSLTGTVTVGRVGNVDIQIDDDSVSRRHAELVVNGREVTLKDLGSANGTTVNGAPINEETILNPGDIVQFGVVEVMFETGTPSGSRAPIARPGRPSGANERPARPSRLPSESLDGTTAESSGPPMDPKKKRLIIVGSAVLGLLFVAVLVKAFNAPPENLPTDPKPLAPGGKRPVKPVVDDPVAQIEDNLAECRTFSSTETGAPDWSRAEAACNRVIEAEPIHAEANSLIKRITLLKVCERNFNDAHDATQNGKLEEAIEAYAKIGRDCESYLLKSISAAVDTVAEVKKRAGTDCKNYATANRWDLALKRCELYTRLACQMLETKDLIPPALMKMKLEGPLNPKTEWRPADPLIINFYKAREKVLPGQLYGCPEIPAFRPPPKPKDKTIEIKEELAKRYAEPEMGRALGLYFGGDFQSAPLPLQKITESMSKAQFHEAARALLIEMNNAINLYKDGSTEITNDRPEKAAVYFQKALAVDERLILGEKAGTMGADEKKKALGSKSSFVRRNVVDVMSRTSYEKGKALADRKDFRAACKYWKLGLDFTRANLDLLKAATNVCTPRAKQALDSAQTCEQLKAALDFAVDGDGNKAQIDDAMAQMECTPN